MERQNNGKTSKGKQNLPHFEINSYFKQSSKAKIMPRLKNQPTFDQSNPQTYYNQQFQQYNQKQDFQVENVQNLNGSKIECNFSSFVKQDKSQMSNLDNLVEATTPIGLNIAKSTLSDFIKSYHQVSLRGATV